MADYIPHNDGEFLSWEENFVTYASANTAALGLTAADITALTDLQGPFETDYLALLPAQAAARAATQARNASRGSYIKQIRSIVKRIQANPNVTDQQRENLGITVPKPPAPVPAPSSRPIGEVEEAEGQVHIIQLMDSASGKRGKPDGVTGAEMYLKIDNQPPAGPEQMSLVNFITKNRFEQEFTGTDVGKTAYYMFRWMNSRGERGPWSQQLAATIAA